MIKTKKLSVMISFIYKNNSYIFTSKFVFMSLVNSLLFNYVKLSMSEIKLLKYRTPAPVKLPI